LLGESRFLSLTQSCPTPKTLAGIMMKHGLADAAIFRF
jgi:hypothetical protein